MIYIARLMRCTFDAPGKEAIEVVLKELPHTLANPTFTEKERVNWILEGTKMQEFLCLFGPGAMRLEDGVPASDVENFLVEVSALLMRQSVKGNVESSGGRPD